MSVLGWEGDRQLLCLVACEQTMVRALQHARRRLTGHANLISLRILTCFNYRGRLKQDDLL